MRENRVSASKSLNTEEPLIFADIVINRYLFSIMTH